MLFFHPSPPPPPALALLPPPPPTQTTLTLETPAGAVQVKVPGVENVTPPVISATQEEVPGFQAYPAEHELDTQVNPAPWTYPALQDTDTSVTVTPPFEHAAFPVTDQPVTVFVTEALVPSPIAGVEYPLTEDAEQTLEMPATSPFTRPPVEVFAESRTMPSAAPAQPAA